MRTHTHTQRLVTASAMAASLCAAPLNRHPEGGLRVFKVVSLKVHAYFQDHVTVHKALWNCPLGCVWTWLALVLKYFKCACSSSEGGVGSYTGNSVAVSNA